MGRMEGYLIHYRNQIWLYAGRFAALTGAGPDLVDRWITEGGIETAKLGRLTLVKVECPVKWGQTQSCRGPRRHREHVEGRSISRAAEAAATARPLSATGPVADHPMRQGHETGP